MIGNCVIAQSGGPTSVINASATGAIFEAFKQDDINKVYGARNGIEGIINEKLINLSKEDLKELEYMKTTPSSSLGSCRYHLKHYDEDEEDYIKIFKVFEKFNIQYFFYIGGNDSMDTVMKISEYAKLHGFSLKVIGIPKTIDNDLMGTDHCPGFGSAAKYIATSVLEIALDAEVYETNIVTIIEVMGRNAGWLAASSCLAKLNDQTVPDLIYLPEIAFDFEQFKKDVKNIYDKKGKVIIVVSEGIKDKDGNHIAKMNTRSHDEFGHAQLGGVGVSLKSFVQRKIEDRVKVIELGVLQRCAMHFASLTDLEEAYNVGSAAVKYALEGHSGFMVGIHRLRNNPYESITQLVDIKLVANHEKMIPREYINKKGNGLTEVAYEYLSPLVIGEVKLPIENGLPRFIKLKDF